MTEPESQRPPPMAHVIVRREGGRYVAHLADGDLRTEGDSAAAAMRAMQRSLVGQVNESSTQAEPAL